MSKLDKRFSLENNTFPLHEVPQADQFPNKVPVTLTSSFNSRSIDVSEIEIKFLVPDVDKNVFEGIKTYFEERDMVRFSSAGQNLISLQYDTLDGKLFSKGTTIRVRGDCSKGYFTDVQHPDICVKTGKTKDESGALRRGEYEARISDFDEKNFDKLFEKYPEGEYQELHKALEGMAPDDLVEFFRIDCFRRRQVIEITEEMTGIEGKKFYAELMLDDVAFAIDVPGAETPLVFHRDLEVECEALYKPCEYHLHDKALEQVSSPMTIEESNRAMTVVREMIEEAAGYKLIPNFDSKAERGFNALDKTLTEHENKVKAEKSIFDEAKEIILSVAFMHTGLQDFMDTRTLMHETFAERIQNYVDTISKDRPIVKNLICNDKYKR